MSDEMIPSFHRAPDSLGQAQSILLGGSLGVIDWTRDPITGREALLRRKWIEDVVRDLGVHMAAAKLLLMSFDLPRLPRDLRHALAALERMSQDLNAKHERHKVAAIQRKILFGETNADETKTYAETVEVIEKALNPIDADVIIQRIEG